MVAAVDGTVAGNYQYVGGTIVGLNWDPGQTIWVTFLERNDVGNDAAFAIDNFTFSASTLQSTNVTWNTTSGTWDTVTGNWTGGSPVANLYKDGDMANFGNIATSSTITIAPGGVSPLAVQISNAANTYTFTGGPINGICGLTISGPGSAALTSSNTYSGNTTINGGTLIVAGGDSRLGSTGYLILNGGTLQTATTGISSATRTMYVNGGATSTFDSNGFNSSLGGSIFINAPFTKAGSGNLTFAGTATNSVQFGAAGSLTINSSGSVTIGEGGYSILTQNNGGTYNGNLIVVNPIMLDFNGGTFSGTGQILLQATGSGMRRLQRGDHQRRQCCPRLDDYDQPQHRAEQQQCPLHQGRRDGDDICSRHRRGDDLRRRRQCDESGHFEHRRRDLGQLRLVHFPPFRRRYRHLGSL